MTEIAPRFEAAIADRYVLERELGRGGMAVVFLAHDLKHGRAVALKLLHPDLARQLGTDRFLREIQLTARLQHPHILPLFDSGEDAGQLWYVMPYVKGESLRQRLAAEKQLPLDDAIRITRGVLSALACAHQEGVLHRDIKPENILLDHGEAVVADFGLAQAVGAAGEERLTGTGFALGTPVYMSPEQAAGERSLGPQSDIYSVGCVLYEMLTGEPPFTGATPQAVIAKRFSQLPQPVRTVRDTVPVGLEQALQRALSRVPADRFASAGAFADALQTGPTRASSKLPWQRRVAIGVGAVAVVVAALLAIRSGLPGRGRLRVSSGPVATAVTSKSLAVLPFRNLGDSSDAYYGEGLAEELHSALVRIQGLAVRPRALVNSELAKGSDLDELARRLKAGYLIEGSVRRTGRRVRVNVELVQADAGVTTWSQPFEVADTSIFAVEDSIVSQVATALSVQLTPMVRDVLAQRTGTDAGAYDLYLQGKHYANLQTPDGIQHAIALYNQAIAQDSSFADAWVALAGAYEWLSFLGSPAATELRALWGRAVQRAIALDSLNGEAYVQRAALRTRFDWDYEGADRDYRRAIALSPGSANVHLNYAQFLNVVGLNDSALAVMRRAVDINPTVAFRVANLVPRLRMAGQLDEAAAEARHALTLDSTMGVAHFMLAAVTLDQGKPAEAALEAERGYHLAGDLPSVLGAVGRYYGRAGRRAEAISALAKLNQIARRQYVQWVFLAEARLGVNDRAGALDALEESAAAREPELSWKLAYGHFDDLRGEPRFQALLARVGLAEIKNRR